MSGGTHKGRLRGGALLVAIVMVGALSANLLAPPDVAAQVGGEVQGTVTDSANGNGIANVEVCVVSYAANSCDVTNSDGTYSVTGIPTGNYWVEFSAGAGYFDGCYPYVEGIVRPCQWIGVVSGTVIDGIDAQIARTSTPTRTPSSTPTVDGHQGTVTPTPTASPTPTATVTPRHVTPTITPTPSVTPTATPTLVPGTGVITGRVTLLATGESIFGARVCARLTFPEFEQCGFSDSNGGYRLGELLPGNYFVTAVDPGGRYLENCFGERPCDEPERIGVQAGVVTWSVNVALDPLFNASRPTPTATPPAPQGLISGRVTVDGLPPTGPVEVCTQQNYPSVSDVCQFVDDDGVFTLPGLRTGNYVVIASPEYELIPQGCYGSPTYCIDPIPVGVVSPYGRVGINIRLDSTPDPADGPTPTPLPRS